MQQTLQTHFLHLALKNGILKTGPYHSKVDM